MKIILRQAQDERVAGLPNTAAHPVLVEWMRIVVYLDKRYGMVYALLNIFLLKRTGIEDT